MDWCVLQIVEPRLYVIDILLIAIHTTETIKNVLLLHFSVIAVIECLCHCSTVHNVSVGESDDVTDYYWREYTGVVPSDALPGGTEKSGKSTYIGQMYSPTSGLLPATIYRGSKKAKASAGGVSFNAENYVKILCSRHHERYQWIATRNAETHLLTNVQLVIGGTEAGYVLNIGRVKHEMETVVGKVFAQHTPYRGLSIPHKEIETTYQSYEILAYCENSGIDTNATHISVINGVP